MKCTFPLLISVLLVIIGCSSNDLNDFNRILQRSGPTVNDDMLTFENQDDYEDYYAFIDSISSNSSNSDSSLQLVENNYPYVSFRSTNYRGELSASEFRDYLDNEYISDINLQSIINSDAEVQIDSGVYVYLGKNLLYRIESHDSETIDNFRRLPKGGSVPPVFLYNENVSIVSGSGEITIGSFADDSLGWRTSDARINVDFRPITDGCTFGLGRTLFARVTDIVNGERVPVIGDWSVTWDDGTANTVSGVDNIELNHTWLEGDQSINIEITCFYNNPVSGHGIIRAVLNEEIGHECMHTDFEEEPHEVTNGEWKMVSKIWYNRAYFNAGIHAYTHAWKLNNNNQKWQRRSTKLKTWVGIDWETGGCYPLTHDEEMDDCNNCRRVQAAKVQSFGAWFPGNPGSTHRLQEGNLILNDELKLDPCN